MVAAPILIPSPANLALDPAVKEQVRAYWAHWWLPFRDQVRREVPEEDSLAERATLIRFVGGLAATMSKFGPDIVPALRGGFDTLLQDLVCAEDAGAPTERRLGIRFLSRAVQVLDAFFEVFRAFGPQIADSLSSLQPDDDLAHTLDPASIAMLRLELAVFVSFDLVEAESAAAGEFVEWARRAQNAANRASPYVALIANQRNYVGEDPDHLSANVSLSAAAFDRVVELGETPPMPSTRLRGLLRGRNNS